MVRWRVSIPTRGNTLFRLHTWQADKAGGSWFQSPLGETPCSGSGSGTGSSSPVVRGFNPHSGKHPVPAGRFNASCGAGRRVSIPTRGNTLFRARGKGARPGGGDKVSIPTRGNTLFRGYRVSYRWFACTWFQSPLGETPCSGHCGAVQWWRARREVSIPTRGNTLFRASRPCAPATRAPRSFQSPLGETPCSGRCLLW